MQTIVASQVDFPIDNQLFKGHLLVPHQIEASSKKRDKVTEVESAFKRWIKIIETIVVQGNALIVDDIDSGPLKGKIN